MALAPRERRREGGGALGVRRLARHRRRLARRRLLLPLGGRARLRLARRLRGLLLRRRRRRARAHQAVQQLQQPALQRLAPGHARGSRGVVGASGVSGALFRGRISLVLLQIPLLPLGLGPRGRALELGEEQSRVDADLLELRVQKLGGPGREAVPERAAEERRVRLGGPPRRKRAALHVWTCEVALRLLRGRRVGDVHINISTNTHFQRGGERGSFLAALSGALPPARQSLVQVRALERGERVLGDARAALFDRRLAHLHGLLPGGAGHAHRHAALVHAAAARVHLGGDIGRELQARARRRLRAAAPLLHALAHLAPGERGGAAGVTSLRP